STPRNRCGSTPTRITGPTGNGACSGRASGPSEFDRRRRAWIRSTRINGKARFRQACVVAWVLAGTRCIMLNKRLLNWSVLATLAVVVGSLAVTANVRAECHRFELNKNPVPIGKNGAVLFAGATLTLCDDATARFQGTVFTGNAPVDI